MPAKLDEYKCMPQIILITAKHVFIIESFQNRYN